VLFAFSVTSVSLRELCVELLFFARRGIRSSHFFVAHKEVRKQ